MSAFVGQTVAAQVTDTRGVTLKCRLASGQEGYIHGISFNRKKGRNFKKGDQVMVIVTSDDPFQIALTKEFVKPLLIFDMHGVLGEREPFQKGKPRRFIRRPHSQEFIRFCAERFELAVWSCAMKKNIDLKMFNGIKLIFVWTQDESTSLYPYMSVVSEFKPLFLKELSAVWEKYPSYDISNTILLDNHIEKCERNPLGTCIIVPDFLLEEPNDDVISPHGEIAQHLRAMTTIAHATPEEVIRKQNQEIHLSRYISARAGSCPLFPRSYQSSVARRLDPRYNEQLYDVKEEENKQTQEEKQTPAVQRTDKEMVPTAESLLPAKCFSGDKLANDNIQSITTNSDKPSQKRNQSYQLVMNVLSSVLRRNEEWIERTFGMNYMPIFPRKHIFREDIRAVTNNAVEYVVCDAMVGEVVLYVINAAKKEFLFIFSDFSVIRMSFPKNEEACAEMSDWLDGMCGEMTVFIGELGKSVASDEYIFFCLDVVLLNGIATSGKEGEGNDRSRSRSSNSLLDRMGRVNGWLFSSPLEDNNLLFNDRPILFKCKEYSPLSELSGMISLFVSSPLHEEEGGVQGGFVLSPPSVPAYEVDGVVFTPINKSYFDYIAYKWKPTHLYGVDVSIALADIFIAMQEQGCEGTSKSVVISVPGQYTYRAPHSPEAVAIEVKVAIMTCNIPLDVRRRLSPSAVNFRKDKGPAAMEIAMEDSCLVLCKFQQDRIDEFVAIRFYSLRERRVFSLESRESLKRLHVENILLSEFL